VPIVLMKPKRLDKDGIGPARPSQAGRVPAPTGISGQALAGRAFVQAEKFGAEIVIPVEVSRLRCNDALLNLELRNGRQITSQRDKADSRIINSDWVSNAGVRGEAMRSLSQLSSAPQIGRSLCVSIMVALPSWRV
jgi:hypothetical protein